MSRYLILLCAALGMVLSPVTAFAASAAGGEVDPSIYRLMVFVIAIFVGYYVVWSVTPALHTPLMSVTNAISSVIVVGALLAVGVTAIRVRLRASRRLFGFLALVMASVNIFGGFLVTQRMLAMYKKKAEVSGTAVIGPMKTPSRLPALHLRAAPFRPDVIRRLRHGDLERDRICA